MGGLTPIVNDETANSEELREEGFGNPLARLLFLLNSAAHLLVTLFKNLSVSVLPLCLGELSR